MKLLIIDSTIRPREISRTAQLLDIFVQHFLKLHPDYETESVTLRDLTLKPLLNEEILTRDTLIEKHLLSHPMFNLAHQFAAADQIVLAAPFWDLSFPAILKIYLEHLCVSGITFGYGTHGPEGYCHADRLTFLQTSGGFTGQENPAASYLKSLCQMFGIPQMEYFCAEGLDIKELKQDAIWAEAVETLKQLAQK